MIKLIQEEGHLHVGLYWSEGRNVYLLELPSLTTDTTHYDITESSICEEDIKAIRAEVVTLLVKDPTWF